MAAWSTAAAAWPGQVRQQLSDGTSSAWEKTVRELADQRLGPLDPALGARDGLPAVTHLIVLPSPELAGIPIEALVEARSGTAPRYLVSYVPSGTLHAWLQDKRRALEDRPVPSRRLLALGDPVPAVSGKQDAPEPSPPDQGLLVRFVQRGSNAAQGGIQPGDVVLRYAGTELATREDLQKRVQRGDPMAASVAVAVWRNGSSLDLTLKPGQLGVQLETRPAAEAILAQREGDALIRRTRGARFERLPGSRREVQAIASLFDRKDVFLGRDASRKLLEDLRARDNLKQFGVIHLATHGTMDDIVPMNSRLLLSQEFIPDASPKGSLDRPADDGTVTAGEVMSTWKLNAELVTLSACQSGLGRSSGGEGFIGFGQALFLAGARSLVLSLWEVDDRATSMLMTRFYQNWLGKRAGLKQPMSKALSLHEAKQWLRGLSSEEAEAELEQITRGEPRAKVGQPAQGRPFEHPHFWAGFILMGDPR